MQGYFLYFSIFFSLFFSCKNHDNELPFNLIKSSLELQKTANSKFTETLILYEEKINFTDSIGSTIKSFINPYRIVEQYDSVRLMLSNSQDDFSSSNGNNLIVYVDNNLNFLLDSLIKNNIEQERPPWKEYVNKIQEGVSEIKNKYGNKPQLSRSELFALNFKVESIYNLAFQLTMRHKMEEEYRHDIKIPEVIKDELLKDGSRELKIQAVSGIIGDGKSLEIYVDGKKVDPEVENDVYIVGFHYMYDPMIAGDSLTIKAVSKTYLNGEVIEAEIKYKTKKE